MSIRISIYQSQRTHFLVLLVLTHPLHNKILPHLFRHSIRVVFVFRLTDLLFVLVIFVLVFPPNKNTFRMALLMLLTVLCAKTLIIIEVHVYNYKTFINRYALCFLGIEHLILNEYK